MRTSDLLKSLVGVLSLGKSNFEPFRQDRFFKQALGLSKIRGSVWMRQRLDSKAELIRDTSCELGVRAVISIRSPWITVRRSRRMSGGPIEASTGTLRFDTSPNGAAFAPSCRKPCKWRQIHRSRSPTGVRLRSGRSRTCRGLSARAGTLAGHIRMTSLDTRYGKARS